MRKSSQYDSFEINSERDIKSISDWLLAHYSLIMMRILEKFWKACNEIWIRVETVFVPSIQDTEYLVRCQFCHLHWAIPEKIQKGGLRIYFPSFSLFYLTPGNFRQNKAQRLDISQNCVRFLGNSKARSYTDLRNFYIIFSWSPFGKSVVFLIKHWKFHMLFLWYPWKFHVLDNT